MNICFVSDLFDTDFGGIPRAIKTHIKMLLRRHHKITVITSKYNKKKSFEKKKNFDVYRFYSVTLPRSQKEYSFSIPKIKKIFNIFKKEKIDIVHFHTVSPLSLACLFVAKKLNISTLTTSNLDSETFFSNIGLNNNESKIVFYKLLNKFYNRLDLVIVPSSYKANLIKKFGLKKRPIIISNGINTSEFNPNLDYKPFLRKFKLNTNNKKILFVGRLMKEKGLHVLIKAFSIVNSKFPNTELVIMGKGYIRKELETHVKKLKLKNVIFTGFFSSDYLKQAYASSDVFVLPSYVESQGLVLLEAATMGLPLIGANTTAIPELVINGWNGYTFEPGNHEDLANKIIQTISNEKMMKKFSKNSKKLAKEHDMEKTIDKYEEIYKNLLQN